jgi:hypothetical protein
VEGLDVSGQVRSVGGAKGRGIGRKGRGGEGVVAVVEKKRGVAGGGVNRVVVGKFGGGEVKVPVVLKGGNVRTEVLNDGFVGVLSLSVRLGVIRGGHVEGGASELSEGSPEVGSKSGVTIGYDGLWPTMQSIDVVVKNTGHTFRRDGFGGGDDVDQFGETADEEDESVVAAGGEG